MRNTTTTVVIAAGALLALARTAVGDVVYVPDDYPTITAAVEAANQDNEHWTVWVRPGIWPNGISIAKPLLLQSTDGPEVTTIAESLFSANSNVEIRGFTFLGGQMTITNGNLVSDCTLSGSKGVFGGAISIPSGSPTIENCRFIGNSAQSGGGAIYSGNGFPTIIGCDFIDNQAGYGGAVCFETGDPTDHPLIVNCTFTGNTADLGGAIWNNVTTTIVNSVFFENYSLAGGGVFNTGPGISPRLINCTLVDNNALIAGGAMFNEDFSLPVVLNSIFWSNSASQIHDDLSLTTVKYSLINFFPGNGNIFGFPDFLDDAGGDLRLLSGSIAIDAGHNWAIAPHSDTDLDGNPRFAADKNDFDPGCGVPVVVDMGAYEFQGDPFPVQLGDITGDGVVGINDFLDLLADWGTCTKDCCLSDLDLDGDVGIADFLTLLANWTT